MVLVESNRKSLDQSFPYYYCYYYYLPLFPPPLFILRQIIVDLIVVAHLADPGVA